MNIANVTDDITPHHQVDILSGTHEPSPHRLIQLLLEGALEKVAMAKSNMNQNLVAAKGENISAAISIIDNLMISLDKGIGGEVAENLESLYDYLNRRLLKANISNDSSILDEVSSLLGEIKWGWDNIPDDVKNAHEIKEKFGL